MIWFVTLRANIFVGLVCLCFGLAGALLPNADWLTLGMSSALALFGLTQILVWCYIVFLKTSAYLCAAAAPFIAFVRWVRRA